MIKKTKEAKQRFLDLCNRIEASTSEVNAFETEQERHLRIERCKNDFGFMMSYYFPHYATSETPFFHTRRAKRVKSNRVLKDAVQWFRGSAKSVTCNVTIPFWLWMNQETRFMVLVGNNETAAKMLLSDLQAEFDSNIRIINDFGEQKRVGSWEDGFFITADGFVAKALGMGQSPRGLRHKAQRPDYIVADDLDDKDLTKSPKRQREVAEWILRDLIPTMDGPIRRFQIVNNRFAPQTIQTLLLAKNKSWFCDRVDGYDPVTKAPTWPEKYGPTYYQDMEEEIGTLAAMAEFNNSPHVEGTVFKAEQIIWMKPDLFPKRNHMKGIVGFWDIAPAGNSTSDFNAVPVWGIKDDRFYHLASFCAQSKMTRVLEWMAEYQKNLPDSVHVHWLYEEQFYNDEITRTIKAVEKAWGVELNLIKISTPKIKKLDRLMSLQPYFQNERLIFNENDKASNYLQTGLSQLYGVEPGSSMNDDWPDASQQAIQYLSKNFKSTRQDSKPVFGKGIREQRTF